VQKTSKNTSLPTSPTVNYLTKLRGREKKIKKNKNWQGCLRQLINYNNNLALFFFWAICFQNTRNLDSLWILQLPIFQKEVYFPF
jgi:hypothetical protein